MNQGTNLGSQIGRWIVLAALVVVLGALLLTIRPVGAQTSSCAVVGDDLECTYAENGTGRVYDFHATDPDRGGVVIWATVEDPTYLDHGDFEIDRRTGVLTFKNPPDFENPLDGTPPDDAADNVYMVKVKASDGEITFADIGVKVTVTNKEEDGTVTLKNLQPQVRTDLEYNEPIDDDDSVNVSGQQWSRSRSMTSGYSNITGATSLTYSPKNDDIGYYLRVTVTYVDGAGAGHDTAMASSMYPVRAQPDEGNTNPMFRDETPDDDADLVTADNTTRDIDENTPAGMNVGAPVVATDDDLDVLTYSLGETDMTRFSIDQVTGQIMTKVKLDYEATGDSNCVGEPCSVPVTATDPSGGTAPITVAITVNNLNEAPKITAGAAVIKHKEDITPNIGTDGIDLQDADENAAIYVATDDTPDATFTWELSGDDADKFMFGAVDASVSTVATSLPLQFKSAPDFEMPGDKNKDNIYEITVVVRDAMWAKDTRDVTIKVTNEEETGSVKLSHTYPEVEALLTATLSDPDGGETGRRWQWHRLELVETEITDDNAIIGKTSPRYEPVEADDGKYLAVKATYTDRVRNVNDDGIPTNVSESASAVSAFAVRPKESNNPLPYFRKDRETSDDPITKVTTYTRYVEEEQSAPATVVLNTNGTAAGTGDDDDVAATDTKNGTDPDPLVHTLREADKAYFDLSVSDDLVTLVTEKKLDYETKRSYTVKVTATDPSGGKRTVTVTIKVVNKDENPEITGPKRIEYMENGTAAVETYMAEDPEDQAINWTLAGTDGGAEGDFKVTSLGGGTTMLAFKKSPNYEKSTGGGNQTDSGLKIYDVTLQATAVGALADCAPDDTIVMGGCVDHAIRVMVTDVEEAPEFSKSTATLSVRETTPKSDASEATTGPNDPIGTETAKDNDGDKLTYSLGGRDADSFNIIPATGQIIRKGPLDFETKNMYQVTVTATDPSGLKDDIAITIEVLDVPEKPVISSGGLTVSGPASESYAEKGTGTVGTYEAEGENAARARWSLEGADSGDFRLSSTSGATTMLRFRSSPNFEAPADAGTDNTYMVTVKATEGTNTATQDVTVTVTNVEEDGTVTLDPARPSVGTPVTATLDDEDILVAGTVAWVWATADAMGGTYTTVSTENAVTASYTPVADDAGKYLRATATYNDGFGTGNTEMAVSASAVSTDASDERPAIVQRYDTDGDGIDIDELFNAIDDYFTGGIITIDQLFQVIDAYFE